MRASELIGVSAQVFWEAACTVAGRLHAPAVERWQSPGGRRVVVVAPHPDDEVLGCAGTLIRHRQAGDAVCILYVTDGSASRSGGLESDQMAAQRRREADAAAQALGSSQYEWLALREGAWSIAQVETHLSDVLSRFAPDILYVPSRIDFHPEHHRVAKAVAAVLAVAAGEGIAPVMRIYQAQVPLTPLLTNLVTETESVSAQVRVAFRAHASQWASIARGLRARRYAGRYYRATSEAEEFWQLTAQQYSTLHASPVEEWSRYESLRHHPIYDARAYLSRLGERRMLARTIADTGTLGHAPTVTNGSERRL